MNIFTVHALNISRIAVIFLFVLSSLASCSKRWTKHGFQTSDWNIDSENCHRVAAQSFPPNYLTQQLPGYTSPVQTNCTNNGGMVNCTTTGGESYPITTVEDLNEGNRNRSWERCIRTKGYYTVGEQPQKAKKPQLSALGVALREAGREEQALCKKPEFASFYNKTACKVEDLTTEQLSDSSKVTKQEKKIVHSIRTKEKQARAKMIRAIQSLSPNTSGRELIALIEKYDKLQENLMLGLLSRQLNYGEYNTMLRALNLEAKQQVKAFEPLLLQSR